MNQTEYKKKIIDQIDQSQLANESNSIDVRAIAESTDYDNRKAINKDPTVAGNAYNASTKAPSDFEKFAEMNRFNRSYQIDEDAIRKNQKMKLSQDVDDVAGEE